MSFGNHVKRYPAYRKYINCENARKNDDGFKVLLSCFSFQIHLDLPKWMQLLDFPPIASTWDEVNIHLRDRVGIFAYTPKSGAT